MAQCPASTRLRVIGTGEQLHIRPRRLVVAGYTARDRDAVDRHITELAAIGVPPPATVPAFYDLDPALLTTEPVVEVAGPRTSGEVEPVLVRHAGRCFVAVGSDHTDRELERAHIGSSKAACPKPIGGDVAEFVAGSPAADWDRLVVRSSVDGRPYQSGPVSTLRHPADLIEQVTAALGPSDGDLVMFCGTLPLLTGAFVYGTHWRLELELPSGQALAHSYDLRKKDA
ncbi:DUF2848 family protein [Streptomyces sp. AM 4-1-1]|uniref:DUF2848 family protein n=1 Tax=Streptomyces sp. AM 4-1-1 TaxID=3028710 RepID=UPI0023B89305|nr:DUF2848 family protein [Streptomyces sp. AM 4-1-1]WEH36903.1 DUF2848 family protein [Streptomyces sp. AM 4-1-1]